MNNQTIYSNLNRFCQLCNLQQMEPEDHIIFRYQRITSSSDTTFTKRYGGWSTEFTGERFLSTFFWFPDQRLLSLFMKELLGSRSQAPCGWVLIVQILPGGTLLSSPLLSLLLKQTTARDSDFFSY